MSRLAGRQTDRELKALRAETEGARRRILWQSATLLPVTLGLILLFTLFLARPIRRIDDAIGRIGQGRLDVPVVEQGPTDLRALARQLEWLRLRLGEISEERNRFLRHMSHELKTPLANIREGSELMLDGAVGELGDGQREVAGILRDNSLRLQRLIENLLSYSEWQAKRGRLDASAFRLVPFVDSAIEPYQLQVNARRLKLDLAIDDVEIEADRAKLRLVLDNLVSNAIKFTPDGGAITVRARLDGEALAVDVADTGPRHPARGENAGLRGVLPGPDPTGRARARDRHRALGRPGIRAGARRHDRNRGRRIPGRSLPLAAAGGRAVELAATMQATGHRACPPLDQTAQERAGTT